MYAHCRSGDSVVTRLCDCRPLFGLLCCCCCCREVRYCSSSGDGILCTCTVGTLSLPYSKQYVSAASIIQSKYRVILSAIAPPGSETVETAESSLCKIEM